MSVLVPIRHALRTAGTACAAGLLLSACASSPFATQPPEPELQLLAAGPLELPHGCEPVGGKVYRTNYLVQPDGRVSGAASASGAGCVQDTLRRWVESFQYRPLAGSVPATIDWMGVTAARGS